MHRSKSCNLALRASETRKEAQPTKTAAQEPADFPAGSCIFLVQLFCYNYIEILIKGEFQCDVRAGIVRILNFVLIFFINVPFYIDIRFSADSMPERSYTVLRRTPV